MIDKFQTDAVSALADVADGSTVLIGGFGAVGQPVALIDGLIASGARDLTVVANNAGFGHVGVAKLLAERRVRKIICSFPRTSGSVVFDELYKAGQIELEVVPQGTLAERLRAAGAGIPAFYTATGAGTLMEEGKEVREIKGRRYLLEYALHGDVAIVDAWAGDRWGNLTYRETQRNFNPVMASAAKLTVAQVVERKELGELNPEAIVTPGVHVTRLVHVPNAVPVE